MSKEIKNRFQLVDVCRSAGLWYVGSFMEEFLRHREKWEDEETKNEFIEYMFNEYGGADKDINGTRTRVNCVIRIIESGCVEEALNLVLEANDNKLGCQQSKINAKSTLEKIKDGILKI